MIIMICIPKAQQIIFFFFKKKSYFFYHSIQRVVSPVACFATSMIAFFHLNTNFQFAFDFFLKTNKLKYIL